MNAIVALVLVLVLTTPSWAQTVRFEAETDQDNTSCTANMVVGYAMGYGHSALYQPYSDAGLSGGNGVYTALAGADVKLVFVGTGVDMIAETRNGAADFEWILDDAVTTAGAGTQDMTTGMQTVIPLVSGLTNTIHTLRIDKEPHIAFRDNASAKVLRVDAFDVHDSGTRLRIDDGDTSAVLQTGSDGAVRYFPIGDFVYNYGTAGDWLGSSRTASAGSFTYTVGTGHYCKVDFTGAGIVFGTVLREVSHDFAWNLDNAFDGQMSIKADSDYQWGIHWRWPYLISNELAPGSHTLTITSLGGGVLHNVDFFDVIAEVVPVELSSFEVE